MKTLHPSTSFLQKAFIYVESEILGKYVLANISITLGMFIVIKDKMDAYIKQGYKRGKNIYVSQGSSDKNNQ